MIDWLKKFELNIWDINIIIIITLSDGKMVYLGEELTSLSLIHQWKSVSHIYSLFSGKDKRSNKVAECFLDEEVENEPSQD